MIFLRAKEFIKYHFINNISKISLDLIPILVILSLFILSIPQLINAKTLGSVGLGMSSQEAKVLIPGKLSATQQNPYKANMIFSGYDLESGNFLSITTIGDVVRYIELDWVKGSSNNSLMDGRVTLGKTSPGELIKELGSSGFKFKGRFGTDFPEERIFILSYNMNCGGGEIVNFAFGTPTDIIASKPAAEILDKHTKLKAVMLSDLETLQFFWGSGIIEAEADYQDLKCFL